MRCGSVHTSGELGGVELDHTRVGQDCVGQRTKWESRTDGKQDLLCKSTEHLGTEPETYFTCDFVLPGVALAEESGHANGQAFLCTNRDGCHFPPSDYWAQQPQMSSPRLLRSSLMPHLPPQAWSQLVSPPSPRATGCSTGTGAKRPLLPLSWGLTSKE